MPPSVRRRFALRSSKRRPRWLGTSSQSNQGRTAQYPICAAMKRRGPGYLGEGARRAGDAGRAQHRSSRSRPPRNRGTRRQACAASQFRVKLGTIRPPTTEMSTMSAASPSRHPKPGGRLTPAASRCISKLAMPKTVTAPIIGRLRQFRPATISRAQPPRPAPPESEIPGGSEPSGEKS